MSTAIPLCVGIRFSVGKILQRIYQNTTSLDNAASSTKHSHIELIRRSLGFPFHDCPGPVQVIISSENGMDKATVSERATVAAVLWSHGISCDYSAHSGLIMSLLELFSGHSNDVRSACEWNSETICGICAVLQIPFVVVVVPHLFSSKNVVKLRATTIKTQTGQQYNYAGNEELVGLAALPSVLLEKLHLAEDEGHRTTLAESNSSSDLQVLTQLRQTQNIDVDCTYCTSDQYYDDEHKGRAENSQWKNVKKIMKTSTQKMANHLNNLFDPMHGSGQSIPIIATDLPFRVVRDIGSCLILNGLASLNSSESEVSVKYPEHKKTFRTLMYALDNQIRKSRAFCSASSKSMSIYLYSIPCDKYDLVLLAIS